MSQRLDLREFQQSLAERLLAAQQSERGKSLLEIESGTDDLPGGRRWLVDPAQSGEIAPLPALTSVPLTQPWFAGIANIRGTLFSVVDFAAWRGGQATPRTAQSRLLLIGARDGSHSALLVERVLGLRTLDSLQAQVGANGAAQNNAAQTVWQGTCFTDAPSGVAWTCLDIPALLATPAYLDIAL
ncbi:MAG: chemotaxis protein CheW [Rugosibacter sp.]